MKTMMASFFLFLCALPLAALGVREGTAYPYDTLSPQEKETADKDSVLIEGSGIPLGDYQLNVQQGGSQTWRYYSRDALPADKENQARAVAAIDDLHAANPSLKEIVRQFGAPSQLQFMATDGKIFVTVSYGGLKLFFGTGGIDKLVEIRLDDASVPYRFKGRIGVGSGLKDAIAVLGEPLRTIKGKEFDFGDRVLSYVDDIFNGNRQYISYGSEGVRIFCKDEKITALYLFNSHSDTAYFGRTTVSSLAEVPPFSDVRQLDLSSLSSGLDKDLIRTFWFNARNKFSASSAEIADGIMDRGKNPGLGVRALHARGITGRGVSVAIIDQNLPGTGHPEYAGKVTGYFDAGCNMPADQGSMHGPAVLSLLVGTAVGTAPDARVYYAAAPSWTADAMYYAKALRWIIERNTRLSDAEKIRVVSVSAAPSGPGSPFTANGGEWDGAVKEAESAGILVLDCTTNHGIIGAGYYDPEQPEDLSRCSAGWPGIASGPGKSLILAPTSFRSQAEEYSTGQPSYQYTGRGGLSWGIPYAAGVLAMGWQVNPALPPAQMVKLLQGTAYGLADGSKMIDPAAFIEGVMKTVGK